MILVLILFAVHVWLIAMLVRSMKKHPNEQRRIQSAKSAQEIADEIKRFAAENEAEIDKIEDDPLEKYSEQYDIAVVVYGKNKDLMRSHWAVQLFVKENEVTGSTVDMVALAQAASGYNSGIRIEESRAKCEALAQRIV